LGKVFLQFIVNNFGYIGHNTILKGVANCQGCNKEALRIVGDMPGWKPARMFGKSVICYFNLPNLFRAS